MARGGYATGLGWGKSLIADRMGSYFDLLKLSRAWLLAAETESLMLGSLRCVSANKQNSCFDELP